MGVGYVSVLALQHQMCLPACEGHNNDRHIWSTGGMVNGKKNHNTHGKHVPMPLCSLQISYGLLFILTFILYRYTGHSNCEYRSKWDIIKRYLKYSVKYQFILIYDNPLGPIYIVRILSLSGSAW